jgi:DNA-binding NtrC family response regulator
VPVDLLLVIADEALRHVIEVALLADGFLVRSAIAELDAVRTLSEDPPDVVILDGTMPLSPNIVAWIDRNVPGLPLVLLRATWDDRSPVSRRATIELPMPFGRKELRQAVAIARGMVRK